MSRSPPDQRGPRGGGGGDARDEPSAAAASGAAVFPLTGWRRAGDPSSSRARSAEAVWPEHFVESVAAQIAVSAARDGGRLAAAPAVVAVFQVCSRWRAISESELLWEDLASRVWNRHRSSLPSWRDEFIGLHRTAANFRSRRSTHSRLLPPSPSALSCRRLTISDHHLAAGFLDGSVRLFDLPAGRPVATFPADHHRDRLGLFSLAVAGIVLDESDRRLVFASQDGDVHVAPLGSGSGDPGGFVRRAHPGNLTDFGILVDFAGDARRWVGLFAGPPGWAWHVWDAATEQVLYRGGTLTDADSVAGWHLLTDASMSAVGRVRLAAPGVAVGCTASIMEVIDVEGVLGARLNRVELQHGAVVGSVDAGEGRAVVVDRRGVAEVLGVPELEEVCSFSTARRGEQQPESGEMEASMNWGYVVVCSASAGVSVWDARTGEYLYSFRERVGEVAASAAGDRYVAAWANDTGLHLWDYGAL